MPKSPADSAQVPPPDDRYGLRSSAVVLVVYLFLACLTLLGAWALIAQDWLREQQAQDAELAAHALANSEFLGNSLREANDLLNLFDLYAVSVPNASIQHFTPLASRTLSQRQRIAAVLLRDADDRVVGQVSGSRRMPHLPPLPTTPQDYARAHSSAGTIFHPPSRADDGRSFLAVERTLNASNGRRLGSALAFIGSDTLITYLRKVDTSAEDRLSLLDTQGNVVLQLTQGKPGAQTQFSALPPPDSDGTVSIRFEHAGKPYVAAIRPMREYGLLLAVSRPADVSSPDFLQTRQRLIAGALSLILLLGALAWLIQHEFRRQKSAHAAVARLNASLEERVHQRTGELEQFNREQVAFSYSISHDLRAPLRAINGFAHALREDSSSLLDTQGKDYVERIYRASLRMGELIDALLKLASISRSPLSLRKLDLGRMAEEIIDDLRKTKPDREVLFSHTGELHVEADEALMQNALANLIANAWKFTRDKHPARISLSGKVEPESVRLTLCDNGIGFDMAHARHLFQPFQQLHNQQTFGGTGIGLASARRIIERHGGQIEARSSPGEGACFSFTLPRRARVIRRRQAP